MSPPCAPSSSGAEPSSAWTRFSRSAKLRGRSRTKPSASRWKKCAATSYCTKCPHRRRRPTGKLRRRLRSSVLRYASFMKRSSFIFFAAFLAVCLFAPARAQQTAPYRILISNDDGVRAPGLAALAEALKAIGEVIVVAPSQVQSGKSHSVVTIDPVFREDLTLPGGLRAIGLNTTPATTMFIALANIVNPKPDLVVSGINRGYNLGYSVYRSGTVAGAREGAM